MSSQRGWRMHDVDLRLDGLHRMFAQPRADQSVPTANTQVFMQILISWRLAEARADQPRRLVRSHRRAHRLKRSDDEQTNIW